jgi:hypothetical protein
MHAMSMNELQSVFSYLSVLGGVLLGLICGTLFTLFFGVLRHRSFPPYVERGLLCFVLAAIPPVTGFFFFRAAFGKFAFHPLESVWHIVLILIIWRADFFFTGAFFGLVITLALLLHGIKRGTTHAYRAGREADRRAPVPRGLSSWG